MPTDFDRYIGQRLRIHRENMQVSVSRAAIALQISTMSYRQGEVGIRRFFVSEIFAMRKCFRIPIDDFFTFDGIYIPDLNEDVISSELTDVIHYFPKINDMSLRQSFAEQIRESSSIF